MKEILKVRNNYNGIFGEHKQILLHFTEIVVNEVFSIKNEVSKQKLLEVIKTVQYLEMETLNTELEAVWKNFTKQLISNGGLFILENDIIKVPCCSDCYFKNIVKKSIDKKMPFKPKIDKTKMREVGDNGFKDTVIWYSIIEYIKKQEITENDHIILLTENISDFKSEDTLREFESLTGKKIHITNFKSANSNYSKSPTFLSIILENSKDLKIGKIDIADLKIKDEIQIHSIKGSPLYFNLAPLFPKYMDTENFESILETEIKRKFLSFGFNVDDLEFNFVDTKVVAVTVNLRNYKLWFLDIDSIELELEGGIFMEEFNFDVNFGTDIVEYDESDIYFRENDQDFRATIVSILEDRGYHIDPDCIDYEVVEFIPPAD
jgi:hypothetical protein